MKYCSCGICENEANREMVIRVKDYLFLLEMSGLSGIQFDEEVKRFEEIRKRYEQDARCGK